MEYKRLKGLKMEDYQYPGEKKALEALRKLQGIDKITAQFIKLLVQTTSLPEIQGNSFRISLKSCPEIYKLYLTALERLDMPEEYPLYSISSYDYNAFAFGGGSPFVCIHSSMLSDLEPEEIIAVLGHELGHIKGEHSIYDQMARMIKVVLSQIEIPGGGAARVAFQVYLMEWYRAHEYSADRAGMIACGRAAPEISLMSKLMGTGEKLPFVKMTPEDIMAQEIYFEQSNNDLATKLMCVVSQAGMSHPFTALRIKALDEWEKSGEFEKLVLKYV